MHYVNDIATLAFDRALKAEQLDVTGHGLPVCARSYRDVI